MYVFVFSLIKKKIICSATDVRGCGNTSIIYSTGLEVKLIVLKYFLHI